MEMLKFQLTCYREFERLSAADPVILTDLERAARFGFALHQIWQWEQGRYRPLGGVRAYLLIIAQDPERVSALLRKSAPSRKAV